MSQRSADRPASLLAAVDARVVRRVPLCREHVALEFVLDHCPPSQPGQFLQLACADCDPPEAPRVIDWPEGTLPIAQRRPEIDRGAFLRRPFSIADRVDAEDGTHLTVISRAIGVGTRWLERLTTDSVLNLTGPLGRGFDIPDTPAPLLLIGGGVGIPPLLYLARHLHAQRRENVTLILGAMTRDLLPVRLQEEPAHAPEASRCVELPGDAPYPAIITTDDGSAGLRGYTTDALRLLLERTDMGDAVVMACGPEPMLRTTAHLTRQFGVQCQLCIERPMGCGLGTCLSCVVRVRDAARPNGWRWALACSDGPVFSRDALLDYADAVRS